jgi:hypothetical protein
MEGRHERSEGWLLVGIVFAPPTLMSLYLGFSRWPSRWFTESCDWTALALSVGVGVACIARLHKPLALRVVFCLLYIPAAGFALVLYFLYFVGVVFGDWL